MIKKEISELKRLFTPSNCAISRICGCYVDGEKDKKTRIKEAFLSLPEEDMFKYFEIFRKCLSGSFGKNLLNLDFPLDSEKEGGTQEFLLQLRNSQLKDDELLNTFYDRIIETYEYTGNYLILVIHGIYDIPGKTSDGLDMDDASEEVYNHILCCVCPVELSKPGLSYHELDNTFGNRVRDWVVGMPDLGFLFPAFNTVPQICTAHCTIRKMPTISTMFSSTRCLAVLCPWPPVSRRNPSRPSLPRPWGQTATTRP